MMPRGQTGTVYRATFGRNDDGDPIDNDGNVIHVEDGLGPVGTIYGVLVSDMSANPTLMTSAQQSSGSGMPMQTTSDTVGSLGIPIHKRNMRVKFGDKIVIDGVRYRVVSRPQWDRPHTMTTTRPAYVWVDVDAVVDG